VRERIEFLLGAAQVGNVLLDDHQYWIDFASLYQVRQVMLEFGRRFAAAGVLAAPDDVFHLSIAELQQTAETLPRIDRRRLVGAREAEIAYFRTIPAPPVLGTPPSTPLPATPFFNSLGRYAGVPPAEAGDTAGRSVAGNAGAPGKAQGVARVARTLADAAKLQPGDVLVAVATSPSWTPLFGTAAAIVTDTGGILSHAAIVAREYGIPAVVGTGNGTTRIHDGQLVEIDGDAGIVRFVVAAAG
jgi:pyruvate,water dikinase